MKPRFRNVWHHSPNDAAPHAWRTETSIALVRMLNTAEWNRQERPKDSRWPSRDNPGTHRAVTIGMLTSIQKSLIMDAKVV